LGGPEERFFWLSRTLAELLQATLGSSST